MQGYDSYQIKKEELADNIPTLITSISPTTS